MMTTLHHCVHLWSNSYYICGRLLHLWLNLITFVVVVTFVASTTVNSLIIEL